MENSKIIYDLGCSTNKTIPEAIGVDIREGVTDIAADIHSLPFEQYSADIIISRHSIEHLLDPTKAMKEWIRVLKPGGKMVIILPDHEYINTMDDLYSRGQHLHAYTRESFCNFLSLFPELVVTKCETVLDNWSFGTVAYKLPSVSILIPHIKGQREEGLFKCKVSLYASIYPPNQLEIRVIEGDATVPQKINSAIERTTAEYICYAANDTVFNPDTIRIAITESIKLNKGLVSFNEGQLLPDEGNINCHFIIRKDLIPKLDNGELFCSGMNHVGVDNYLWQQCKKMGESYHSENAKITHNHFSKGGTMDSTYEKGWKHCDEDRKVLAEKLSILEGK